MDGRKNSAGAVSMVRNVKHPVTLARFVMENTSHVFLSGQREFRKKAKSKQNTAPKKMKLVHKKSDNLMDMLKASLAGKRKKAA